MKNLRNYLTVWLLLFMTMPALAQGETGSSGFGQFMRSEGRIHVVVAVMLTILIGLILYMVRVEKKIKKLEDKTSS